MKVRKKPSRIMITIRINNERIEQVDSFNYLGVHLNENGYIDYIDTQITKRKKKVV